MDVAVVATLFNGAEWIRSTLDSVVSQTHPPSELIVVDDGSTDGSPDIVVEEYPGAQLVENPGNGPCEARNHGVRCATADNVAFLDQDDLWHEDHLKLIDQTFQAYPECVGAFSSDVVPFAGLTSLDYAVDGGEPHLYDPWDDYPQNVLGEPVGGVLRRNAVEHVDGWWTEAEGCGDYHLWLKLGSVGDLAISGYTTAGHRVHDQALSWSLRHDQVVSYFARHVKASEEVLGRRDQHGLPTDRYVPRLEAQKTLLDFLRAIRREDRSGMQGTIKEFGRLMAGESRSAIRNVWGSFWWYAKPSFGQQESAGFAADLIDLIGQWPETLRRPREFLYKWSIGRASSLDLVRRHPGRVQNWSLLFQRGIRRLRSN